MSETQKKKTETKKSETKKSDGKKLVWPKMGKIVAAVIGTGLLLVGILLSVKTARPAEQSADQTLYSYEVDADSTYRVHLLTNDLYPDEWMGEGGYYPDNLTDYIEVTLNSACKGSEKSNLSGNYTIYALLTGYVLDDNDEQQIIYQKQVELKSGTLNQTGDALAESSDTVDINLAEYESYVDEAETTLGSDISESLDLIMEGTCSIDSDYGTDSKEFSYDLPIPLSSSDFFQITKPDSTVEEGNFTQTVSVPGIINLQQLFLGIVMAIAGGILLAVSLFAVRIMTEEERYRGKVLTIMRKYGSRMVQIENWPNIEYKEIIHVINIEQMLLMAEEMQCPVFYCSEEKGFPKDGRFCIPYQEKVFICQISHESCAIPGETLMDS